MRAVLSTTVLCICVLAYAGSADAQSPTNFTVDPAYESAQPALFPNAVRESKLSLSPELVRRPPEFFEPPGSSDGEPAVGMSVTRSFNGGRTTVGFLALRQFKGPPTSTPHHDLARTGKGVVIVGGRYTYKSECKSLFC